MGQMYFLTKMSTFVSIYSILIELFALNLSVFVGYMITNRFGLCIVFRLFFFRHRLEMMFSEGIFFEFDQIGEVLSLHVKALCSNSI